MISLDKCPKMRYNDNMMIDTKQTMSEFRSWEELSELEQAQGTYCDMHKDAYGFRPREDTSSWTVEDFDAEFVHLGKTISREMAAEAVAEAKAVKRFEQRVTDTISLGARDRETALRWLMEASEADGDWEHFCFLNGLPFGWFEPSRVRQ